MKTLEVIHYISFNYNFLNKNLKMLDNKEKEKTLYTEEGYEIEGYGVGGKV